jgi:MscS family membrane protein
LEEKEMNLQDSRFKLIGMLLLILFFCMALSEAEENQKPEEKTEKKVELHLLANEELLKQGESIFNDAHNAFFAQLRGMFKSETFFTQGRDKAELFVIPEEKPGADENIPPAEAAKMMLDHTQKRAEAIKQRLELIEEEKVLADKLIAQIEAAQSAALVMNEALERLNFFQLEISLRVADGTLPSEEVPEVLTKKNLEIQRDELTRWQETLKEKAGTAQKELENTVLRIEEGKKLLIEAEAYYASAKEKYSQEMKRQTVEQEYSEKTPERLIEEISKLQEERLWLNTTFNLSYKRFSSRQEKALEIQKELESLSPPDAAKLQTARPEDTQEAGAVAEELIAYHENRIKRLGDMKAALESLIKYGETLGGDATVLSGHLFKMQVIATTLDDMSAEGKIKTDSIPKEIRTEKLAEASKALSEKTSEASAVIQKAKEQIVQAEEEIKKSETARKDTQDRLANLKKAYESVQEAQEWESSIKDLTAEQILQNFQQGSEKLEKSQIDLQKSREEFEKANAEVEAARMKLDSLKDPLLRLAQNESIDEKTNILRKLYEFAGLELPKEKSEPNGEQAKNVTADADAGTPETEKPAEETKEDQEQAEKTKEEKKAEKKEASATETYENRLSTRVRIIEEHQKYRGELVNVLNLVNQKIEELLNILTETKKLALQHHANAVELKKRLGRGQLNGSEIPDGITEALKPELITQLETEAANTMNYQIYVRQEAENLSKGDETLKEALTLLTETQGMIGKRLDAIHELNKLEQETQRKRSELSQTELQSLEQEAVRRMEAADKIEEYLLGFVPSERAKNLTELLKAYYMELIELDIKQDNLNARKEKTERLIQLAEDEKTVISKLLPVLQKQKEQLEVEKEEEWVKIRARLMPEKAEEILSNFETKTGRRLSMPARIPKERMEEAIQKITESLFNRHVEVVAAGKWIALFEERLSSSGINAEIGAYQDQMGGLNALELTIQRRVQFISGHPLGDLAKLPPEEKPKTETDQIRFLEGETGVLRAERYSILTRQCSLVLIKLGSIFLTAMVISWLVNFMVRRAVKRAQKSEGQMNIGVLPLLRTLIVFIVWGIAIISILSILGFNVGAILAGLGIGGLAIAMAAKETLADIIGGISIFISKSVRVGELIIFKGEKALVEDIGLQYSRLRPNADEFLITVPNSLLAQSELVNVSQAPGYFVNIDIPLSICNTKEQIDLAVKLIMEMINNNDALKFKNVKFSSFANYAFVLSMRYIIKDYNLRHIMRTEVHLEIVRLFQENGIAFATAPISISHQEAERDA